MATEAFVTGKNYATTGYVDEKLSSTASGYVLTGRYSSYQGDYFTVPVGGTWLVLLDRHNRNSSANGAGVWIVAGGTRLSSGADGNRSGWFALEIAK